MSDTDNLTPGQRKRVDKLIELAEAEFGPDGLTEPERKVLRCAAIGVDADFTSDTNGYRENLDMAIAAEDEAIKANKPLPPASDRPVPKVKLSAKVVRWMLADTVATTCVDPLGVGITAAEIVGSLDLSNCSVPKPFGFSSCVLRGGLSLVQTKCQLVELEESLVGDGTDRAIFADRMNVASSMLTRNGFRAEGAVRLLGAKIGGNLECTGGRFNNKEGNALFADRADVAGYVFLRDGFRADGVVNLLNAKVGSNLECWGGWFNNKEGKAIVADGMSVGCSALLRNGFRAEGEVSLLNTTINGGLYCAGGQFVNDGGIALNLTGSFINGTLRIRGHENNAGTLDLRQCEIGTLDDAPSGADVQTLNWPKLILLSDCRYNSIEAHSPLDAKSRLNWLRNQDATLEKRRPNRPPDPQPYRHLANVLKKQGHEDDARTVLRVCAERRMGPLAKRALRHGPANPKRYIGVLATMLFAIATAFYLAGQDHYASTLTHAICGWSIVVAVLAILRDEEENGIRFLARQIEGCRVFLTQWMYRLGVGHGYARWRALAIAFVLIMIGAFIFDRNSAETIQPSQARALMAYADTDSSIENNSWVKKYPPFDPIVYSADTLIPLLSLQQENFWTPSGRGKGGWFIKNVYLPFHIAMGWVIATLFVASFTRLMRQEG